MLVRPRRPRRRLATAALLAATALVTGPPPGSSGSDASASAPTSYFAALDTQVRVLDTRQPGSPIGRLAADTEVSIDPVTPAIAASLGLSESEIVAVVANVTLDAADGWGFATVYPTPSGEPRPNISSINTDTVGQTVANMVTARLGAGGLITVYSSVGTDVIVDIQGVYVQAIESRGGRLVDLSPARARDTRPNRVTGGQTISVDLTPFGVPANASAAVLNVTAVEALSSGFLTVWNGQGGPPNASNVNYEVGSIVANQVITDIDAGRISIFTHGTTDILVDIVGYMTGPSATLSSLGLFVPLGPGRMFDSRLDEAPSFATPVDGGSSVAVGALSRLGIPGAGVAALNTNTTLTATSATGFATVWGAGGLPGISSLNNVGAGRTVANHVISDVDAIGCVNLYTSATTDAILDVTGYFTGSQGAPPFAPLDLCDGSLTPPPGQPGGAPSAGPHEFLFLDQSTPPPGYGRWDPCRPAKRIGYAVNTLRATQREIDEMTHAIRVVERATGFDFVPYQPDPTTTEGLGNRMPPTGADFLIGFTDVNSTPQVAGGVVGIGGGFWFPNRGEIFEGYTLVDVPDLSTTASLRSTLIHEMGHALGLDHVGAAPENRVEIMYPSLTSTTTLGPGDRQGFWRVGTAQPCIDSGTRPSGEAAPVRVERPVEFRPH